jgi:hypothetical protein
VLGNLSQLNNRRVSSAEASGIGRSCGRAKQDEMFKTFLQKFRGDQKRKKRGKNVSPRNKKVCHTVSTALLKSVAEIGTQ